MQRQNYHHDFNITRLRLSCFTNYIHPEDGSSMDLWNNGILPQNYTSSQPKRPRFEIL